MRLTQGDNVLRLQSTNQTLRISNVGVQGAQGSQTVELVLSITGVVPENQLIQRYIPTEQITFRPADGHAILETATVNAMSFPLRLQNGTLIGSADWGAGQTVGAITMSQTVFADGEILDFHAPAAVDPAINTVIFVLPGERGTDVTPPNDPFSSEFSEEFA